MSKTYNSDLQTLNVNLQTILNAVNNLPEASEGIELPELTNEAVVSEVFEGKEVINSNGEKVTGTFTIDNEVSTQTDLITQIATALAEKAAPSGGGGYEWTPLRTLPTTYSDPSSPDDGPGGSFGSGTVIYYLEIPSDVDFVMFRAETPGLTGSTADAGFVYWETTRSGMTSFKTTLKTNHTMETITCSDVSTGDDRILQITLSDYPESYNYLLVKAN